MSTTYQASPIKCQTCRTKGQISEMDLPTKPRNPKDRRSIYIRETVEAEAMPARAMRELLRQETERYLPSGALEAARAAEESERRYIDWIADAIEEVA